MACSACFVIALRTRDGTTHSEWAHLHQSRQYATGQSGGSIFSIEFPSSQMTVACIILTHKTSHHILPSLAHLSSQHSVVTTALPRKDLSTMYLLIQNCGILQANHSEKLWRFSYQWKKVCRGSQRAKVEVGKSADPILPPFLFIIHREPCQLLF